MTISVEVGRLNLQKKGLLNRLEKDEQELKEQLTASQREIPRYYIHGLFIPKTLANRDNDITRLLPFLSRDDISIIALNAIEGAGKSVLAYLVVEKIRINRFTNYKAIFWFSFHIEDSFERFLTEAFRCLIPSCHPENHPSPFEKAAILAEELKSARYLIVLDGIESMLFRDRQAPNYGSCKDKVLHNFLLNICSQISSKIIITTCLSLSDLEGHKGFQEIKVEDLPISDAVQFLEAKGIKGSKKELRSICRKYGGHLLTLDVLSAYLIWYHQRNANGINEVVELPDDGPKALKLHSILKTYWSKLTEEERYFMIRLSFFRSSIARDALWVLSPNKDANNIQFSKMLRRLKNSCLIQEQHIIDRSVYSLHPLIKSYVYRCIESEDRINIHKELKEYAQTLPIPERPSTLADYDPVLEVYYHCIHAGMFEEAFEAYHFKNLDRDIFWWGHYSLIEDMLNPLLEAHQHGDWLPSSEKIFWVLKELALVLSKSGDPKLATVYHRKSIDITKDDAILQSKGWQYLSESLAEMGKFGKAIESIQKAEIIESTLNNPSPYDRIIGRKGYYNAALGNTKTAMEQLTSAVNICMTGGDDDGYHCLWLRIRGDLYMHLGQFELAEADYTNALYIARSINNKFKDYEGHILRGLGDIRRKQKKENEATDFYKDALFIAHTTGYSWLEAELDISMALLDLNEGKKDDAREHALACLKKSEECNWLVQQAQSCAILAKVDIIEHNFDSAYRYIYDAKELMKSFQNHYAYVLIEQTETSLIEASK